MGKPLTIPHDQWAEASGGLVEDDRGGLWRIVGFIDRPAVMLDPVKLAGEDDDRQRQVLVMSAPITAEYHRLVREDAANG